MFQTSTSLHRNQVFFAEAKYRLLQNVMYVDCCKQTLGLPQPPVKSTAVAN